MRAILPAKSKSKVGILPLFRKYLMNFDILCLACCYFLQIFHLNSMISYFVIVLQQVFDDVAVEMALALLQFLSEKPPEPLVWRGLKSLLRCCQLARSEVMPLEFKICLTKGMYHKPMRLSFVDVYVN